MEYDFKSLSDYDFELICGDLLSAALEIHVESFRRGRDHGVDLRYSKTAAGSVIVQCKHYANTPFSGLYRTMAEERSKIIKFNPDRYLLMTSQFLTADQKDKLFLLLRPFCKSAEDIIGGNEINALLRLHPDVEQAHYKLWLTSTAVLQKILHSGVYQQSKFLQEEIEQKLKLYVQSPAAYGKARKILDEYNCCIISGIPGIGKTTLAEILLIYYLNQGYQIIKVRSDIREAINTYRPDLKQVFLYDDFLGSTALKMESNKNEGRDLLSFLSHISRQKSKKFILTTREYILNQARQNYEEFARHDFNYNKCVISLADYTKADRARILYNHLFFYEVPKAGIENLLINGRIMDIIDHPNYNPRLIESVTNLFRFPKGSQFYDFFIDTLNHPNKLWENSFRRKISPAAKDLLIFLCLFPLPVNLNLLKHFYSPYHRHKAFSENRPMAGADFMDALKETEGTFIKIDRTFVSYHNPSVRDFIQGYLRENKSEFQALCEGIEDFDLCIQLTSIDENLCNSCRSYFLDAIRRTLPYEVSPEQSKLNVPAARIKKLLQINEKLQFSEITALVLDFIKSLPGLLEDEKESLSVEAWRMKIEPHKLRDIFQGLETSGYHEYLGKEICLSALHYAQAWFQWSFSYTLEDFLFFRDLSSQFPFTVEEKQFQSVYEALEDYRDQLSSDFIRYLDYESQIERYLDQVESLEDFFHMDLSSVKEEAEERIFELSEMEGDEIDDSYTGQHTDNPLDNSAILDMFQSLLYRNRET